MLREVTCLKFDKAAIIIICGTTLYITFLVLKSPLLCLEKDIRFFRHLHKHHLFHLHA